MESSSASECRSKFQRWVLRPSHPGDCPDDGSSTHPETSVYFNETTRRCISEGCNLHTGSRENLKSHLASYFFRWACLSVNPVLTYMRFQVLTAASMKFRIVLCPRSQFWTVLTCSVALLAYYLTTHHHLRVPDNEQWYGRMIVHGKLEAADQNAVHVYL
jgi:hypothetical protein